jgi:hypothetical protein
MVWWFVRIHIDESARSSAVSEDALAALPARATRVIMNGDHTTLFDLQAAAMAPINSHKV